MPQYMDRCLDSKDVSKNKILDESGDNMFINVPKDMIIVDPMTPNYYCVNSSTISDYFPLLISKYGNNKFLKDRFSYSKIINRIDTSPKNKKDIRDIFLELYNKSKLYYPTESINNLALSFTDNLEEIGDYCIVKYEKKDRSLYNILTDWTIKYHSHGRHDCVFLDDVLNKLRETYPKKKMLIYLLSCRGTTKKKKFPIEKEDLYYDVILKQIEIQVEGTNNIKNLRPIAPSSIVTRRKNKLTTGMLVPVNINQQQVIIQILKKGQKEEKVPKNQEL